MPSDLTTVMRQAFHADTSWIASLQADLGTRYDGDRTRGRAIASVRERWPIVLANLQVIHSDICQAILKIGAVMLSLLPL